MNLVRMVSKRDGHPFPVYHDLVANLLAAHERDDAGRDATVAHVLAAAAGYAYSDIETVSTITARLGLEDNACVRVARTVDAMYIASTAYLIQSRCGRVVILAYRGTEPANLTNWLADADVGSASLMIGGKALAVHSGFHRNLRATRWEILSELRLALRGRSLATPEITLEHPMQALYVTGHSLGGAMAALFALSVAGDSTDQAITDALRAVYTFGQPMTASGPLPLAARTVARKVHRHIHTRDPIPALPPEAWGHFAHFGHEYRFTGGEWVASGTPVEQLKGIHAIPASLAAFFATAKRRGRSRYSITEHAPHQYLSALRPEGMVTEFGDHA